MQAGSLHSTFGKYGFPSYTNIGRCLDRGVSRCKCMSNFAVQTYGKTLGGHISNSKAWIKNPRHQISSFDSFYAHIKILSPSAPSSSMNYIISKVSFFFKQADKAEKNIVQITSSSRARFIALSDPISNAICILEPFNASWLPILLYWPLLYIIYTAILHFHGVQ